MACLIIVSLQVLPFDTSQFSTFKSMCMSFSLGLFPCGWCGGLFDYSVIQGASILSISNGTLNIEIDPDLVLGPDLGLDKN